MASFNWKTGCMIPLALGLLAVGGGILAAGPDTVIERTKAAFGQYAPPVILRTERQKKAPDSPLIVTVSNPSFEEVAILGYHVEPVPSWANASTSSGGETGRTIAQDVPGECAAGRRDASIPHTITIEPKRTHEIVIHPWAHKASCSFELSFRTSHGDSATIAVWELDTEKLEKVLQKLKLPKGPIPRPPEPQPEN
jgi:hypothetical protein